MKFCLCDEHGIDKTCPVHGPDYIAWGQRSADTIRLSLPVGMPRREMWDDVAVAFGYPGPSAK